MIIKKLTMVSLCLACAAVLLPPAPAWAIAPVTVPASFDGSALRVESAIFPTVDATLSPAKPASEQTRELEGTVVRQASAVGGNCPPPPPPAFNGCAGLLDPDCLGGGPDEECRLMQVQLMGAQFVPTVCDCIELGEKCGPIEIVMSGDGVRCPGGCPAPNQGECYVHANGISLGSADASVADPDIPPGAVLTCKCAEPVETCPLPPGDPVIDDPCEALQSSECTDPETPSQQCFPMCVNFFNGTVTGLECDCRDQGECHVVVEQGATPHCDGVCPAGEECIETVTNNPMGGIDICCTCEPALGACCIDTDADGIDDDCMQLSADGCAAIGGTFHGAGTPCGGLGTCCFDVDGLPHFESCLVMDELCCEEIIGQFMGFFTPGATCQGMGACCFDNNNDGTLDVCWNMDESCCDGSGGFFQGPGSVCLGDGNGNGTDDVCDEFCDAEPICEPLADTHCLSDDPTQTCRPLCIDLADDGTGVPVPVAIDCSCISPDDFACGPMQIFPFGGTPFFDLVCQAECLPPEAGMCQVIIDGVATGQGKVSTEFVPVGAHVCCECIEFPPPTCDEPAGQDICDLLEDEQCLSSAPGTTCEPLCVTIEGVGGVLTPVAKFCDCIDDDSCGPIDVTQIDNPPDYRLSCEGTCDAGEICEVFIDGNATGQDFVNASDVPIDSLVCCHCADDPPPPSCPLSPDMLCDERREIDCPEDLASEFCQASCVDYNNDPDNPIVTASECGCGQEGDCHVALNAAGQPTCAGTCADGTPCVPTTKDNDDGITVRFCCGCCPSNNLNLNLTTGVDDGTGALIPIGTDDDTWTVTCAPSGGGLPRPAKVIATHPAWALIPGSQWVSDTTGGVNGEYCYETCFCLDERARNPLLSLQLLADDQATVFINGFFLGQTPSPGFLVPTGLTTNDETFFLPGETNCITVVVENQFGVVTGFDLAGTLIVENGGCCCGPTEDESACEDVDCPLATEECQPRCLSIDPFTQQVTVNGCECSEEGSCHPEVLPGATTPECVGGCPDGEECIETLIHDPATGDVIGICCDCEPVPVGACCNGCPAVCTVTTQQDCEQNLSGLYLGDDVPCDPDPCRCSTSCTDCAEQPALDCPGTVAIPPSGGPANCSSEPDLCALHLPIPAPNPGPPDTIVPIISGPTSPFIGSWVGTGVCSEWEGTFELSAIPGTDLGSCSARPYLGGFCGSATFDFGGMPASTLPSGSLLRLGDYDTGSARAEFITLQAFGSFGAPITTPWLSLPCAVTGSGFGGGPPGPLDLPGWSFDPTNGVYQFDGRTVLVGNPSVGVTMHTVQDIKTLEVCDNSRFAGFSIQAPCCDCGACCCVDAMGGVHCQETTEQICEDVSSGIYLGDGVPCEGDDDMNGINDACEPRPDFCPVPDDQTICAPLQDTQCVNTASGLECLPLCVSVIEGPVGPEITADLCDCINPGNPHCGPIDITPIGQPPTDFELTCDDVCPPGSVCQVIIDGIPSGQSTVLALTVLGSQACCGCVDAVVCPLPDDFCFDLQFSDCQNPESPDQVCVPRCVTLDATGFTVDVCDCRGTDDCHMVLDALGQPTCEGMCADGEECVETTVDNADGSTTLCCDCAPLPDTCPEPDGSNYCAELQDEQCVSDNDNQTCQPSCVTVIELQGIVLEFELAQPAQILIPDGPTVVGDRVIIVGQNPTEMPTQQTAIINRFANTGPVEMKFQSVGPNSPPPPPPPPVGQCPDDRQCSDPSQCIFDGLPNGALGNANLEITPPDQCNLRVSNIGSSGKDGVRQDPLPPGTKRMATGFQAPNFSQSQMGTEAHIEMFADIPGGLLSTMHIENTNGQTLRVSADISPAGVTLYQLFVILDGVLQYQASGLEQGEVSFPKEDILEGVCKIGKIDIDVKECDCFDADVCGPVQITPIGPTDPPHDFELRCPGGCPADQVCNVFIDGNSTGGSSILASQVMPGSQVKCDCEPLGACCDHAQPGGACIDGLTESDCINDPTLLQPEWFVGLTCAEVECLEHTGACCDGTTGDCTDDVPESECPVGCFGECIGGSYCDNPDCCIVPGNCVCYAPNSQISIELCGDCFGECISGSYCDPPDLSCCIDPAACQCYAPSHPVSIKLCGECFGECNAGSYCEPTDNDECCVDPLACVCYEADDPISIKLCGNLPDPDNQYRWEKGTDCNLLDPPCEEHRGACCDGTTGTCEDGVPESECAPPPGILNFEAIIDEAQATACVGTGSAATGIGLFTLDTATGNVSYNITFSGLESPEIFAHVHGAAPACINAGVVYGLLLGSPKIGVENLTAVEAGNMIDGLHYVNIHSEEFPGGEIRGQIRLLPDESQFRWEKDTLCVDLDPPCQEHTGACCDDEAGFCEDNVPESECPTSEIPPGIGTCENEAQCPLPCPSIGACQTDSDCGPGGVCVPGCTPSFCTCDANGVWNCTDDCNGQCAPIPNDVRWQKDTQCDELDPPCESLCDPDCRRDVNGDGMVGSADLANLLGCWGQYVPGTLCECFDKDGDGFISSSDLASLLGAWGSCP